MSRSARFVLIVVLTLIGVWLAEKVYRDFVFTQAEPRTVAARGDLSQLETSTISLFETAAPSVAYLFTETVQRGSGMTQAQVSQGAGSGFVWDKAGHIVTNFHVIDGAQAVQVQLDTGKPIKATIIGGARDYDLAVVRLTEPPANLRPIPVGTSGDLRIGQMVYAIGNPFGLSRTLTTGIVSALDRTLPTSESRAIAGAIQTDAAINPGNSGGPLLDSAGRLIGVNTAILSESGSSAGVGLAIPVDLVNRIVPQLIKNGKAARPGIGIMATDAARLGVAGVAVLGVGRDSPAAAAQLRPFDARAGMAGDIIVGVNGKPTTSVAEFGAEIDKIGIGGEAELTLLRNGQELKVKVRVADVS
jgi:2-alkenal reductase